MIFVLKYLFSINNNGWLCVYYSVEVPHSFNHSFVLSEELLVSPHSSNMLASSNRGSVSNKMSDWQFYGIFLRFLNQFLNLQNRNSLNDAITVSIA